MAWNWNWFTRKTRPAAALESDPVWPRVDDKGQEVYPVKSTPQHKVTWALNTDEANFNPPANVVSFRTLGFRNLAHPDSPIEYLEADYNPETKRWRLCQCSVGDGRALSVMFNRDGAGTTTPVPTHKTVTLVDRAAFMLVLQKMAVYEFGTDTASQYAMREVVEEDITNTYFMNIAHGAGVIFDANGHPSMTRNGRPLRDGQYPQSELDHAAMHYNTHKPVSLSGLLGVGPLAQENTGLDSFDDFAKLVKFNHLLSAVLGDLNSLREEYRPLAYVDQKNILSEQDGDVDLDIKWQSLRSLFINQMFNNVTKKTNEALGVLNDGDDHKAVRDSLKDVDVMLRVVQAASMMQCYHNKGGPDPVNSDCVTTALASADESLSSHESFSNERKKMIRSFIVGQHSVAEIVAMFDSIVVNICSIMEVSKHAENAAILQSQVKIEMIQSAYEIPMIEGNGLSSLAFIEEKFPVRDGEGTKGLTPPTKPIGLRSPTLRIM